jgi:hypothetical protein
MSDLIGNIWKFTKNTSDNISQGSSAPPILVPAKFSSIGSSTSPKDGTKVNPIRSLGINSNTGMVDVINDLYWTHTPFGKREEVPVLYLSEKRLMTNALVAQAFYSAATVGFQGGLLSRAVNAGQNVAQNFGINFLNDITQKLQSSLGNFENLFSKLGGTLANAQKDQTNFLQTAGNSSILNSSDQVLKVYNGIYITEPTGWNYKLPYFQDRHTGISNNFSDENQGIGQGPLSLGASDLVEGMAEATKGAAGAVNMFQPGTFIERPKFYQFPSNGETFNVKFPLINTGHATFDDVIRNWQFVFLLIYQNRPSRFTRDLIEPPVIYELELPGQKYMPFAYISKLEVQFLGSRRIMDIPYIDESGLGQSSSTITTIIPDGYLIDIDFQGLVGDSRNFDYASLNKSIEVKIQENKQVFSPSENSIRQNLNTNPNIPVLNPTQPGTVA